MMRMSMRFRQDRRWMSVPSRVRQRFQPRGPRLPRRVRVEGRPFRQQQLDDMPSALIFRLEQLLHQHHGHDLRL